jgi:hypothetical protein
MFAIFLMFLILALEKSLMMQEQMNKMGMIIYSLTGQDVVGLANGGVPVHESPAVAPVGGRSMGGAQKNAQRETMTDYGRRLAEHAKPNMEAQG